MAGTEETAPSPCILVIDDEPETARVTGEWFRDKDVTIVATERGEEGVARARLGDINLVLLDLKMPGLHGVEVLRRTKVAAPDIEVIILTGHGTTRDMEECMRLGAFAYMNKPVNIDELSATIKAAHDKVHAETAC